MVWIYRDRYKCKCVIFPTSKVNLQSDMHAI